MGGCATKNNCEDKDLAKIMKLHIVKQNVGVGPQDKITEGYLFFVYFTSLVKWLCGKNIRSIKKKSYLKQNSGVLTHLRISFQKLKKSFYSGNGLKSLTNSLSKTNCSESFIN